MKKIVFHKLSGIKGIKKDIARLTGWDIPVLNVLKKCSTDLEKVYSTRDSSAKISPRG
jgi:hypothetical protein